MVLGLALMSACGGDHLHRVVAGRSVAVPVYGPLAYEHFLRGEFHRERGETDAAAESYRLAIVRGGDDVIVWARFAQAEARRGNLELARAALARAALRDPDAELVAEVRAELAASDPRDD